MENLAKLQAAPIFSPMGKKLLGGGITLLIAGFWLLTKTDPYGRNWASHLAPFLILGGYGIIALGIFLPDKEDASKTSSAMSPPAQKDL